MTDFFSFLTLFFLFQAFGKSQERLMCLYSVCWCINIQWPMSKESGENSPKIWWKTTGDRRMDKSD